MAVPRLSEVECLRGLAISLVVAHHVHGLVYWMQPLALVPRPWPIAVAVLTGYTGVDLFFILSGFLLSRPFLAEARGGREVSRRAYALRRVLRVMRSTWWPSWSRASTSRRGPPACSMASPPSRA
jgi:peptidoglycan/LPS O-acetylase OafA/YrhL